MSQQTDPIDRKLRLTGAYLAIPAREIRAGVRPLHQLGHDYPLEFSGIDGGPRGSRVVGARAHVAITTRGLTDSNIRFKLPLTCGAHPLTMKPLERSC